MAGSQGPPLQVEAMEGGRGPRPGGGHLIEAQQGDPMPPRDGNLAEPASGPARIDGPRARDVVGSLSEYVTSREVRTVKLVSVGMLLLAGAAMREVFRRGGARRLR